MEILSMPTPAKSRDARGQEAFLGATVAESPGVPRGRGMPLPVATIALAKREYFGPRDSQLRETSRRRCAEFGPPARHQPASTAPTGDATRSPARCARRR